MMEAESLHRDAALLSNTLHTYPDDEVEAVKPVIDRILDFRMRWKEVRGKIAYFEKFGRLPEEKPVRTAAQSKVADGAGEAELKLELQRVNVNLSKIARKLEDKPEHRNADEWREDQAKLLAMKQEIQEKLHQLKYAKPREIPGEGT